MRVVISEVRKLCHDTNNQLTTALGWFELERYPASLEAVNRAEQMLVTFKKYIEKAQQ